MIGMLNSFTSFDLVYVMTNGGPGHATELLDHLHLQARLRADAVRLCRGR